MENASKALIMTGAVLLAMLVLSLGIYLARLMATSSSNVYSKLEESDITEFNQQFLNYNGREIDNPLNIQDVVTIIHIAKDNNQSNKMPVEVVVKLDGTEVQTKSDEEINNMLKQDLMGTHHKYSCQVNFNLDSNLVNEVIITTLE